MSKRQFEIIEEGTTYKLSNWRVVEGIGIVDLQKSPSAEDDTPDTATTTIQFVRGSKAPGGEDVEKRDGIMHETLLAMMIFDLKYKNGLVPSREGSLAITKLEEALLWMEERQRAREAAGTAGTYKK